MRIVGLQYPRLAWIAAVQGRVELQATISDQGSVTEVSLISGHALLVDAARGSLRQWRFKTCTPSSARCTAKVAFNFVLDSGSCDYSQCPNDIQIDLPGTVTIKSKHAPPMIN
jgi:TonB family protein